MVDKLLSRLKAALSIPPELRQAGIIVKAERPDLPPQIDRRSRTFVTIRNTMIAMLMGMAVWVPIGIFKYTPQAFFSALRSLLLLLGVLILFAWFILRRIRGHVAKIVEMIAEEYPEERDDILKLGRLPSSKMIFGPWFRVMYVPGFVMRRGNGIVLWFRNLGMPR